MTLLFGWARGKRQCRGRGQCEQRYRERQESSPRSYGPRRPAAWPPMVRQRKYINTNNFTSWDDLAGASGLISRLCSPITLTFFCPGYRAEL